MVAYACTFGTCLHTCACLQSVIWIQSFRSQPLSTLSCKWTFEPILKIIIRTVKIYFYAWTMLLLKPFYTTQVIKKKVNAVSIFWFIYFFTGEWHFLNFFLLPPALSTFNFAVKMKGFLQKAALMSVVHGKIWGRSKSKQTMNTVSLGIQFQ